MVPGWLGGHGRPSSSRIRTWSSNGGLRLGIVSNTFSPQGALDQHLDAEGILEFFPVRVYSCDVGAVPDSFSNDEIGAIGMWRPDHRPRPLGECDAALLNRFT